MGNCSLETIGTFVSLIRSKHSAVYALATGTQQPIRTLKWSFHGGQEIHNFLLLSVVISVKSWKIWQKRTPFPKLDLIKMGTTEKKLTMRAMFGLLLFISYPFCSHTGILKVSLSFLPLCTVFWGSNTYLTDSYFLSRPLERWLHSGWYRTVLSLSWREKEVL